MRLDQMLVDRGLVGTRSRARDLVLRRFICIDGEICDKPSREVTNETRIEVASNAPDFVSRGAEKLAAGLDHFGYAPRAIVVLDIGASTGGFTQILLERGASRVYAVDVGTGQLHGQLRDDSRVVSLEQQDARTLTQRQIRDPVGAIVVDVSFISLCKILPAVFPFAAPGAWLIALIKPQFEVGPEAVGKGGIVRDEGTRRAAVESVARWLATQASWRVDGVIPSPILGGSGNAEYLIGARRDV